MDAWRSLLNASARSDYDFSQGPMLFGGNDSNNEDGNLAGAGQKSGMLRV